MSTFNQGSIQTGDGNIAEPLNVGRVGQSVRISGDLKWTDNNGASWQSGISKDILFSPVAEPETAPVPADSGIAGVLNGTYTYMCTFVTENGETEGRVQSSDIAVVNKKISLSSIPVSTDPRVIARNIYRKPAASSADVVPLKLLVQIANNTDTTYLDNIADASLGVLVNRINTTGGRIYSGANLIGAADTTTTSFGYDSAFGGTGYAGTAFGIHTMPTNAGQRNSAFGMYANFSVVDGNNNTAIGVHALQSNVSGDDNIAIGYTAAFSNLGSNIIAIGNAALTNNVGGTNSVAVGSSALANQIEGDNNVGIGYGAMQYNSAATANQNVAIGLNAGTSLADGVTHVTSAANCTLVGANTKLNGIADTGSIVIGQSAQGMGTNTAVFGRDTVSATYLQGIISERSKEVDATASLTTKTITKGRTYLTGAAGASMAITLPAANVLIDGYKIVIMSTAERVTTTWISTGATGGFIGAPATLAANTPYMLQYDHASLAWYITS